MEASAFGLGAAASRISNDGNMKDNVRATRTLSNA